MKLKSINPRTEEVIKEFEPTSLEEIKLIVEKSRVYQSAHKQIRHHVQRRFISDK